MGFRNNVKVEIGFFDDILSSMKCFQNIFEEFAQDVKQFFRNEKSSIEDREAALEEKKQEIQQAIQDLRDKGSEEENEESCGEDEKDELVERLNRINELKQQLLRMRERLFDQYIECQREMDTITCFVEEDWSSAKKMIEVKSQLVSNFLNTKNKTLFVPTSNKAGENNPSRQEVPAKHIPLSLDQTAINDLEKKYIDRDEYKDWVKSINDFELDCLRGYKTDKYFDINHYLRQDISQKQYLLGHDIDVVINSIEGVLNRSAVLKGTVAYRSVIGSCKQMNDVWNKIHKDGYSSLEVTDKGFLSTTLNPHVAEGFLSPVGMEELGPLLLVYSIESENVHGAYIENAFSDKPIAECEYELLFQHNTTVEYYKSEIISNPNNPNDTRGLRVLYGRIKGG